MYECNQTDAHGSGWSSVLGFAARLQGCPQKLWGAWLGFHVLRCYNELLKTDFPFF